MKFRSCNFCNGFLLWDDRGFGHSDPMCQGFRDKLKELGVTREPRPGKYVERAGLPVAMLWPPKPS